LLLLLRQRADDSTVDVRLLLLLLLSLLPHAARGVLQRLKVRTTEYPARPHAKVVTLRQRHGAVVTPEASNVVDAVARSHHQLVGADAGAATAALAKDPKQPEKSGMDFELASSDDAVKNTLASRYYTQLMWN
jgi:hypothetical protein